MTSPFPGMDPYVEKHWRDMHSRLVLYACDQLEERLPKSFVIRVEERVVFEVDEEWERHFYPDIRVVEQPRSASADGGVAFAEELDLEPVIVRVDAEPMTETFLEIRDAEGRRVVSVIEFLSITNKVPGEGLVQYRRKQAELRQGGVNVVEIDLLRGGRRNLIWPMRCFPRRVRTLYLACVSRATAPGQLEAYPISLRRSLPKIGVPLRKEDQDVKLDLQGIFELAYRKGRYADTIDYRGPPAPPLAGADAEWAEALLKQAGKR